MFFIIDGDDPEERRKMFFIYENNICIENIVKYEGETLLPLK